MSTNDHNFEIPDWAPSALTDEYKRAVADRDAAKYAAVLKRLLHPSAGGVWNDFKSMTERAAQAEIDMLDKLESRLNDSMIERIKRQAPFAYESEAIGLLRAIQGAFEDLGNPETKVQRRCRQAKMEKNLRLLANDIDNDHPDSQGYYNVIRHVIPDDWQKDAAGRLLLGSDCPLDEANKTDADQYIKLLQHLKGISVSDLLRLVADDINLAMSEDDECVGTIRSNNQRPHLTRTLKEYFKSNYGAEPDQKPPKLLVEFCTLATLGWPVAGDRDALSDQEATNYVRNT